MFKLSKETEELLESIENRIDPEVEDDFIKQWEDFVYDRFEGDIFLPNRKKLAPPPAGLAGAHINDAIDDYDLMIRHQMLGVSAALGKPDTNICIRANYGTGIMTSIFGAEIFMMPRNTNTLPTTHALNDTEKMRELIERGVPDIMNGFGRRVFEFGEICKEVFAKYPKIQKYVTVYHPDSQGPLDIIELLWGGEIFYAMYDEPELVHAALELATETYIKFMEKWYELYPRNDYLNPHWGNLWHKGAIVLRSDSAMNVSPDIYKEFIAPYDGRLLEKYGGIVHFCGKGDHYMETLCSLPNMYGINMSQPQYNDMEKIFKLTVDKGLKIIGFNRKVADELKGRPGAFNHCLSV